MNTMYVKAFLFFVLGGMCAGGPESPAEEDDVRNSGFEQSQPQNQIGAEHPDRGFETQPPMTSCDCVPTGSAVANLEINCEAAWDQAKKVSIETAQTLIAEYQLWLRMVPRNFSLFENMVVFDPIELNTQDLAEVMHIAEAYNASHDRSPYDFRGLPFATDSSLATSYYIPKADVMALFCNYPGAEGIRAHMALTTTSTHHPEKVSSHIFLAPAIDKHHDVPLDSVHCLMDLTMPCPNTCGGSDILRHRCNPH